MSLCELKCFSLWYNLRGLPPALPKNLTWRVLKEVLQRTRSMRNTFYNLTWRVLKEVSTAKLIKDRV